VIEKLLSIVGRLLSLILNRFHVSSSYTLLVSIFFQFSSIAALYMALLEQPYSSLPEYFFSGFLLTSALLFEAAKAQEEKLKLREALRRLFDLPVIAALALLLPVAFILPGVMGFTPMEEFYYISFGLIVLGSLLLERPLLYSSGRMVTLALFSIYGSYNDAFEELLLASFILLAGASTLGLLYILVRNLKFPALFSRVLQPVRSFISSILTRSFFEKEAMEEEEEEPTVTQDVGFSFVALVVDEGEEPITGARVTLLNKEQMLKEFKITGNDGKCSFEGLEDGEYIISVEAKGFEPQEHERYISSSTGEIFKVKKEKVQKEEPSSIEEEDIFAGESALIEYTSSEDLSSIVRAIVKEHIASDREVFLAAMPPRSQQYRKEFEDYIKEGKMRVINVPLRGSLPESDRNIQEIPMTNLEYFRAVIEEMPAGSLLIFEPLSSLIINLGKNPAYQFISKTVDLLSKEGLFFISFINKESSEEASMFRDLFVAVAEISEGKLKRIR